MEGVKLVRAIFCALVVLFVVVVGGVTLPVSASVRRTLFPFVAVSAVAFFLLGFVMVFLVIKARIKGKYGKFLILTGVSASGFFISVLLHNFLYGLGVITRDIVLLHRLFEFLHAAFFIVAIFVCPVGFLAGAIGSGYFLKSKK